MPQIRCPNCGTTINLETRRKLDYRMIVGALQKGSQTFTDLLKATGLPRKTLSIRLTALCDSGILLKDRGYRLNGSAHIEGWIKSMDLKERQSFQKTPFLTRRNVLIALMLLLIAVPIAANGLAMLVAPPSSPPSPEPPYIGTFKAYLKVANAIDLFAWQAVIRADSTQLVIVDVVEGDFLKANAQEGTTFQFVDETTNPDTPNTLLVSASLLGMDIPGVDGSGTLAIITFGYKSESYVPPEIIYDHSIYETLLLDSSLAYIQEYTLTLEMEN